MNGKGSPKRSLEDHVGEAMRVAFAEFTGEDTHLVPWRTCQSRVAWLKCADAAIRVIRQRKASLLDA